MKEQEHKQRLKETVKLEEERLEREKEEKELKKTQAKMLARKKTSVKPSQAAFMACQLDYDSQPDEELETEPEWRKGRDTVKDELEDTIEKPPIMTSEVWRGQTRGKASTFAKTVESTLMRTCLFKSIIKIKAKH